MSYSWTGSSHRIVQKENVRTCRVTLVETLAALPDFITDAASGFVLFLAVDALTLTDAEIRATARFVLDMGCAYLSVWGPDCERVHDQFDLERDPNEYRDNIVMTTWHAKDSLDKALWFSLTCAWPADNLASASQNWVGISVGSCRWEQEIQKAVLTHGNQ